MRQKLTQAEEKLKRLTEAYLAEALSLDEYRDMKNKLIEDRATLNDQLRPLEHNAENRLEPTERFFKSTQGLHWICGTHLSE